ncbi:MAG TPA: hypothetical protein VNQ79_12670 [Blastocatellia bacterium]|nr:hypothetical protein [Blastocatellia bacterium]
MEENFSIQRLLTLRKLTRSVADLLRPLVKDYLATLAPVLRPKNLLGDYVQGGGRETARNADKYFREIQELYESLVTAKPFNLSKELNPPLDLPGNALEMTPLEYSHNAQSGQQSKTVIVTSPLKWALSYQGCSPARLRELLRDRNRATDDLKQCVISFLVMNLMVTKQPGLAQILEALHFPIITGEKLPEFGNLPVTIITSSVSTLRPPDQVIIDSTEMSGMDAFEEVVNVEDIRNLRDELKEKLLELVTSQGGDLSSQSE